jgi:hypothetical protein
MVGSKSDAKIATSTVAGSRTGKTTCVGEGAGVWFIVTLPSGPLPLIHPDSATTMIKQSTPIAYTIIPPLFEHYKT